MRALEGSPRDALPHALSKLRPALMANYSVWPLLHLVNFGLVPSAQRILFVNAVSVSGACVAPGALNVCTLPPAP